ncbi:DUF3122 domain-containing protein [Oscillatoriales cyanobacterium LEGE 11467]|uniref:DUF3122 domain-containing protein n=1 Tax=Zarconia navalis LEGE 11467 TaxID=1828826 RepID=A0A928VZ60_9CYAN|nr:DUF3122 domain-containing protein [Zarconia navalis]MBE9041943.1 DUF3122 domain-containing protein [Zarconia navalis LEGE 11467]
MIKTQPQKQKIRWQKIIGLALLFVILYFSINPPSAFAEIRMSEHTPGRLLIQSRHNLKDNQENAWNAILFKQAEIDGRDNVILRLVGFPGIIEFNRSHPLEITTHRGEFWATKDLFSDTPPAANVAQYDMKEILPQLPKFGKVRLDFQLSGDRHIEIDVPKSIVGEWKTVIADRNPR